MVGWRPLDTVQAVIDHITFGVADLPRSAAFYITALAPLGLKRLVEVTAQQSGSEAFAGFGDERPFFWISPSGPLSGKLHVALAAQTRAGIDAFHETALAAGAKDAVGGPREACSTGPEGACGELTTPRA